VYQTLVFSHFTPSIHKILTKMAILPLTLKLHRFEFQNYNTHLAQNDVVLGIKFLFFFFLRRRWKLGGKKKPHSRSGGGRTTPMPKGVAEPKKKNEKWVKMGFGLLGVATPKGLGVASATSYWPPILAKGVAPNFHLFFFFNFHL
jgi:hypothetical protein